MVPETGKEIAAAILFTFCLGFFHCAGDIPPSGGPPDTIPPTIVHTIPDSNAVRVGEGVVELEFSEYVDRRSVEESIFISPYVGDIEFDWSGKKAELTFSEPMRKNATYVVNVGTDVRDIRNGNRMASGYTLAFSTGDYIDRGFISGRVFDEKPEGLMVFAYALEGRNPDTLSPATTKPDYIMQTGKDGRFTLANLAYGPYRVFAVRDEYRNFLYDKQIDQFGVTTADIVLDEDWERVDDVWFRLSKEDTAKPFLSSVQQMDKIRLQVRFSEQVDTASLRTAEFFVSDTAGTNPLSISFAYFSRSTPSVAMIVMQSPLDSSATYRLRVKNVHDPAGNPLDTIHAVMDFVADASVDTLKPAFAIKGITEGSRGCLPDEPIEIDFSEPIIQSRLAHAIELTDTNKNGIWTGLRWLNPADLVLETRGTLKYGTWYQLNIHLDSIVDLAANRCGDSVRTVKFETLDLRVTGTLEGSVADERGEKGTGRVFITAKSVDPSFTQERTVVLNEPGKFKMEKLVEGRYALRAFRDADSNGVYTYGVPFPFVKAERFTVYTDTVKVRARWGVEGILLKFKK